MMAERSSVIGLTREYRPNWSVAMILGRDFNRPQWVRIAQVALQYNCSSVARPQLERNGAAPRDPGS